MSIEGIQGFDTYRYGGTLDARSFMRELKKTRSFVHIRDEVIEQWLIGRLEIDMFGPKKHSHSRLEDVPCTKCGGRGWFGRGRPACPECVAIGKHPITTKRRWSEPRRMDGYDKRRFHASLYELKFIKKLSDWFNAFENAVHRRVPKCPDWIKDISVSGDYSEKDKLSILHHIRQAVTSEHFMPSVEGERLWQRDVFSRKINWDDTVIRLALTFGCVCPITGELVPPDQVSHTSDQSHRWDGIDSIVRHVNPLGFYVGKRIYTKRHEKWLVVSPFSAKGISSIRRAANKCQKALNGAIDSEWILAEVMRSTLLKQSAMLKQAA